MRKYYRLYGGSDGGSERGRLLPKVAQQVVVVLSLKSRSAGFQTPPFPPSASLLPFPTQGTIYKGSYGTGRKTPDSRELPRPFRHVRAHEKSAVCDPEGGFYETLTMLTP